MENGALIGQIAAGGDVGRAAEKELFLRFAPRVRLYGLRHLRDEDRARDLVQAVMLAVIEAARAGRIQELEKVDRFVLGTSRNVALRIREIEARAREPLSDEWAAELDSGIEHLDATALLRCVAKLEARARTVVAMSFVEELAAEQIAEALSTSAGNVRVMRHRALHALRTCLDGDGGRPRDGGAS